MDEYEQTQEKFWNSLTKEQQLWAFCSVSRRIYQAEIVDKGSFRYCLLDVFGFGSESYAQAQLAGYLEIHNSIYDAEFEKKLLLAFCEKHGVDNAEDKVYNFLYNGG